MLESCQNAQERWGGVHKLIDSWLKARHELVRAFDALGAKPEALAENVNRCRTFVVCWWTTCQPAISVSTSN